MTKEFRDRQLIINEKPDEYDGTTAVVRTEHVSAKEVEFMRWKAERWIKVRHIPIALLNNPLFMLTRWTLILAHTFRGTTLKSVMGLEDERRSFERYRAIRNSERAYI